VENFFFQGSWKWTVGELDVL